MNNNANATVSTDKGAEFDSAFMPHINSNPDPRGEGDGKIESGAKIPPTLLEQNSKNNIQPSLTTSNNSVVVILNPAYPQITNIFVEDMVEYFSNTPKEREIKELVYLKGGDIKEISKMIPNPPPLFSEYVRSKKVSWRIFKNAAKKIDELAEAIEECNEIVKEFLIFHGLVGNYQSQFAIFTAKNLTDMKDRSEVETKVYDVKGILDSVEKGRAYVPNEASY